MAFKKTEFLSARLVPREEEIQVPDLAEWFEEGTEAVWKVRGLSGQELGKATAAAEKNREVRAILEGLQSKNSKRIAEAVRGLVDPDTPVDVAKRITMLHLGSVEPEGTEELALKMCREFPVEFFSITNKILELTGKGATSGELKPSGTEKKSGPV